MNVVLPLGSSVLSFVFAGLVVDQWWQRRHGFQLVWAIGLFFYGVSTGAEFLGGGYGWNDFLYRTWYLIGVFLVPAYLGTGTIYLLSRTRFGYFAAASIALGGLFSLAATAKYPGSTVGGYVALTLAILAAVAISITAAVRRDLQGHVAMAFLLGGTILVAGLVLTAHVSGSYLDPGTHVPVATAIPGYIRVASVPFNAGGGLCLVFGALYSAYIYMPKRRLVQARFAALAISVNFIASLPGALSALLQNRLNSRVPATILIAVGALVPGVTSSLNRFGITWSYYLGEFLGIVLIFGGFLVSEEVFRNLRLGATLWARPATKTAEN